MEAAKTRLTTAGGTPALLELRRSMQRLAEACEAIAGTSRKLEKRTIVADYLK